MYIKGENFMTNKEAIKILKQHLHHWECLHKSKICTNKEGEETIVALKLAIKALEEKVDPHYDECDYCKYNDSSDDYPCSECKYRSKWEAIE
jgi:hypothetical protein